MHFLFYIEDRSGEKMLKILLPQLIKEPHTYETYSYKGLGHIPKNLQTARDVRNRMLLNNSPKILNGVG